LFDRNVRRFVVASDYQRDFMAERLGIELGRIAVNYCAIALPNQAVSDPAQGGYVGFAGRFSHEKGAHVMVEACRLAKLPMRLAGDAAHHPAVQPHDDATFVMTRTPAELADFYRRARLIVVPSLWSETFGIVAAEAMSHGVPVVASRLGALQGTVRDGETGLLAEPGDAADFARQILRIWNDPELARRLGRNARRHVETEFSHQAHFDRLMRVYEETIANPRLLHC
jgi:glycosyltransferase involved in cell wall biosynthesis